MGLKCSHTYPCKRETEGDLSQRGEGTMAMEADSGEYWQPPETGRGSGQILT